MSLSGYYNRFGGFLLAATMAGAASAQTAPVPHPLPKTHDMTATEAARYVQQRAAGVCEYNNKTDIISLVSFQDGVKVTDYETIPRETPDPEHAEFIVLGTRLKNVNGQGNTRMLLSTLFINADDRQNCTLMLVPDGGGMPKNLPYVLRNRSDLNIRKTNPLVEPKVE